MECPITTPVYYNAQVVCQLEVERQGLYYHFHCCCHLEPTRILRVYAICGMQIVPLGILMPKDGAFVLDEKISARAWPLDAIDTAICSFCPEDSALPWRSVVDGVTVEGWLRRQENGYELLLPDTGEEFPFPANRQDAKPTVCGDIACLSLPLDAAGQLLTTPDDIT